MENNGNNMRNGADRGSRYDNTANGISRYGKSSGGATNQGRSSVNGDPRQVRGSGRAGGRISPNENAHVQRNDRMRGENHSSNQEQNRQKNGWAYPGDGGGIYSPRSIQNEDSEKRNVGKRNVAGNNSGYTGSRRTGAQGRYEDPNEASMRRVRANQARHREQMRRQREAELKAMKREAMKYNILLVLKIFAGVFVLCCVVFAAGFFILFSGKNAKYPNVTYTYVNTTVKNVNSSLAYSGGEIFINFTEFSKSLGMAVTGGADKMRFVFMPNDESGAGDGTEESVEFETGSARVWINSQETRQTSNTVFRGENVWVPLSFVTNYMNGVKVSSDEKTVKLTRIEAEGSTDDEPVYEPVSFTLKSVEPLLAVSETSVSGVDTGASSGVEFTSDLSAYEQYMNPTDRDTYITLINSVNTLEASYVPQDLTNLVDTRDDGRQTQQMRLTAAKAMEAMFIEMRAAGYSDVSITSAYRSYAKQKELFTLYTNQEMNNDPSLTKEQAEAIVVTYSNRPGTSEHQSGLCADLHNLPAADRAFAQKEAYKWLSENAWKFGFIVRYPENKTEITGVSFEPWHYRFVGRYHALRIKQSGMCLEEYVQTLS